MRYRATWVHKLGEFTPVLQLDPASGMRTGNTGNDRKHLGCKGPGGPVPPSDALLGGNCPLSDPRE